MLLKLVQAFFDPNLQEKKIELKVKKDLFDRLKSRRGKVEENFGKEVPSNVKCIGGSFTRTISQHNA